MIRDPQCTKCSLHLGADGDDRCVMGRGAHGARVMVVTKWPEDRAAIRALLASAGFTEPLYQTAALKCRAGPLGARNTYVDEVKACRAYLDREIAALRPDWILTLGNEALLAVTGHSGIMKHRGQIYPRKDQPEIQCMGTVSSTMIKIQPQYAAGFYSDLRFFVAQVREIPVREYDKVAVRVLAPATLPEFRQDCNTAHGVAFDLETNSLEEYRSSSVIITMALALWGKDATDVEKIWAVPLYHSQSPFQSNWQQWFTDITDAIRCIPVRVAQNAKFDCRWTAEFGGGITATFCTLLAAHIINENRSKSLESLTREEMGLKSWKIDTTDLLAESLKKVLRYNAQDALNTGRLYFILREELRQHSDLARIFIKIMMPLSNELVHDERAGVWIDQKRHTMRWAQVRDELAEIDTKLQQWVPPDPPHPVNFNTSNFLRWWLFEHLELPVIKLTENGGPALDIGTKHYLAKAHPAVPLLIRRSSLMRGDTSFFSAYAELMDTNSRIHTTFRIAGTTTGRLSSGKGDTEKALVKPDRAINLQNVPTDPFYRSTIGAPPDRVWIEADFAQQEFRLAAMLADDPTALQAFATGQDIHRMMAAAITQHALSDVTKQERTRAKPVNFGFLYGAWEKTFIETAWKEYQLEFTMAEARRARRLFFATWSRFEAWHEQQRRFVRRHGYVVTLLGRVRRLPNIYSTVETIRWHAERQAINAPVQSLGSDLTQLAYLGIKHELRERGLERWITGLGSVHDSLLFEGDLRDGGLAKIRAALSVIKHVMENLPLRRMFGIELTVPMIAEITVGQHWGEGKELSLDEISNWEGLE